MGRIQDVLNRRKGKRYRREREEREKSERVELERPNMKMEDPGEDEVCRLCFEGRGDETVNPLISPCRCKGTQKYVHLLCLEKWQNLCLSSGSKDSRAFVCSVCRAEFSIKPRPLSFFASVGVIAQKIGSTSVNFLLVFFFSHIFVSQEGSLTIIALFAALAYSFLYCNFTMAFAVIVLRLLLSFVAPQLVSLRLIWQVGDGGQVGLAFVRYGASIQGLTTGTLLVASRQLEGSIFEKSVIFLHAHDQRYEIFLSLSSYRSTCFLLTFFLHVPPFCSSSYSGVILNNPITNSRNSVFGHHISGFQRGVWTKFASHYVGGPVGLPWSQATVGELVSLHRLEGISGSDAVGVEGSGDDEHGTVMAASGAGLRRFLNHMEEEPIGDDKLRLYHGKSSWAQGQLEGEIRAGTWALCNATLSDLFETSPEVLWESLIDSDRIKWFG